MIFKTQMWSRLKQMKIDDKINEKYYNLSGYVDEKEVRFTYTYPNHFETDTSSEVPCGTDIWIHIQKQLDNISVPYSSEFDFIFTKLKIN